MHRIILYLFLIFFIPQTNFASKHGFYNFGNYKYPILIEGDKIECMKKIDTLEFFLPTWGKDRPLINPTTPVINDNFLYFPVPGEYYIIVNQQYPLKVLVLEKDKPYSVSIERLFYFCVANMTPLSDDDKAFNEDRQKYINNWFNSEDPGFLYCGPTFEMFRKLVFHRFLLPSRAVSFASVTRNNKGTHVTNTHNVCEIYLPDIGKWVLFDINFGYFFKWLNAFEITEKIRSFMKNGEIITREQWLSIPWNYEMEIRDMRYPLANKAGRFDKFSDEFIHERLHLNFATLFYGGPWYWNQYGTAFLPKKLNFANYYQDPVLEKALFDYVYSGHDKEDVLILPPDSLKVLLNNGFEDIIKSEPWKGNQNYEELRRFFGIR